MTRQGKHHTVRSDLTGLTLLIITTKQSFTFYGKMYGKVQYRTPIPSHVPVKFNTVTCAGKGFVTPNIHDELPHSFFSTRDNSNYLQCLIYSRPTILSPRSQEEIQPNGTWIPQDSKGECGKRLTTEQIIGGEIGLKFVVWR